MLAYIQIQAPKHRTQANNMTKIIHYLKILLLFSCCLLLMHCQANSIYCSTHSGAQLNTYHGQANSTIIQAYAHTPEKTKLLQHWAVLPHTNTTQHWQIPKNSKSINLHADFLSNKNAKAQCSIPIKRALNTHRHIKLFLDHNRIFCYA